MATRIDGVKLTLDVYDEFEGRRTVIFDVPLPDDAFLAAVSQKWSEYADRLLAEAKAAPDTGFLPS